MADAGNSRRLSAVSSLMPTGVPYVARRLLGAAATILLAVTLNFLLFRLAPGDASDLTHVPGASPALRHALRHEFGLDQSLWHQYLAYLGQLAHGNLGVSFANRLPVADNLWTAIGQTCIIALPGLLLAVVIAVATGLLSVWRHGTAVDHASRGTALVLYALPAQWVAIVLISLTSGWLPTAGASDPFAVEQSGLAHALDVAHHALLPAVCYALVAYGQFMIVVRASLLQSLSEDYILTARAKGLSSWQVVRRHALRTALLPVTTLFGLTLGSLVAGIVLIEAAFSWPGIGLAIANAVGARDYPMLQGAFLVVTVVVVLTNLAVDLLYRALDPRVRVSRRA
ncbi:MAG: ABC transporter permease [Actinobacteria bacterium]|nr:ABC transporter permease [Actinomycetota bacterium]